MIDALYRHWYFERPELAKRIFSLLLDGAGDPLAMTGERRIGKTSHLLTELMVEAESRGFVPIYVDIQQHRAQPLAAINNALEEAIDDIEVPTSTLGRRLKTAVKKVAAGGVSIEMGDEPARRRPTSAHIEIDWLLKQLLRKAKKPALLIFDEIQELATAVDAENVAASLRSAITKSREQIRVVFTGSSQLKLMEMFDRSRAALYEGASTMPFPFLDDDFLKFIATRSRARFKHSASLRELREAFERLQHRPRSLIDLVMLHASSEGAGLLEVLDQGVLRQLNSRDFESLWRQLSPLQQRICLRIANGGDVSSVDARAYYATFLMGSGRTLVPAGTVSHSLRVLVKSHVLTNTGRGSYRIDDPLFAEWLRRSNAASTTLATQRSTERFRSPVR